MCGLRVWPVCSLPREPFKPNTLWPGNPPSSSQRASILLPTLHSLRPRGLAALELRASLITSYSPTRARRGRLKLETETQKLKLIDYTDGPALHYYSDGSRAGAVGPLLRPVEESAL